MNRSQPSVASRLFHRRASKSQLAAITGFTFLLGALASAPTASGYSFEAGNPRWASGTVTFVLSLGSAGRTLSDGSTSWNSSGSAALSTWNQYMGSLQLNTVVNDSAPVSDHDGVNSVAFASTFFGDSFGSNTLAITGYYYGNGGMTEANVLVNNRLSWDSYRGALRFDIGWDLRRVLIHEVGHALGLDHPDQHGQHVTAVMNSVISNSDTAMADDINGIQAIYGVRNGGGSTPTPTPTPRPSATPVPTPNPTATPSARSASMTAGATLLRVGQAATITVRISSTSTSPVTVNYLTGGNARASIYTLSGTPGQVTIPAGATSATFTVTAAGQPRRPRTLTIYVLSGSGYSIGSPRSASVTISK